VDLFAFFIAGCGLFLAALAVDVALLAPVGRPAGLP